MARYLVDALKWETLQIVNEAQLVPAKGKDRAFVSYVFRHSAHRPRVPVGGTYGHPFPLPGNRLASLAHACLPNWQLFWLADALAAKRPIPVAYVVYGGVYALLVVAFFVLLAVALFWQREVGSQAIA
jgi:hypothetical protein